DLATVAHEQVREDRADVNGKLLAVGRRRQEPAPDGEQEKPDEEERVEEDPGPRAGKVDGVGGEREVVDRVQARRDDERARKEEERPRGAVLPGDEGGVEADPDEQKQDRDRRAVGREREEQASAERRGGEAPRGGAPRLPV